MFRLKYKNDISREFEFVEQKLCIEIVIFQKKKIDKVKQRILKYFKIFER